jgi:hypothetical protein
MIKLTFEQRSQLIQDIKKVYSYKNNRHKLTKMSDAQLFAYRESLRKQGKISRFLSGSYSVHISVFMKKYESNSYRIVQRKNNTIIYFGFETGIKNKYGIPVNYQFGTITLDENWKIIQTEMYGDILKRYNGLELIVDGAKRY